MHIILSILYYSVITVAVIAVACLIAAEYLGRRFTCVYDLDALGKERKVCDRAQSVPVHV